ncbi:hypothetical protein ABH926_002564 [Catenulispora sp. GP43]
MSTSRHRVKWWLGAFDPRRYETMTLALHPGKAAGYGEVNSRL